MEPRNGAEDDAGPIIERHSLQTVPFQWERQEGQYEHQEAETFDQAFKAVEPKSATGDGAVHIVVVE
jgi:hypothetical protein